VKKIVKAIKIYTVILGFSVFFVLFILNLISQQKIVRFIELIIPLM
jgi:hypothetical protein